LTNPVSRNREFDAFGSSKSPYVLNLSTSPESRLLTSWVAPKHCLYSSFFACLCLQGTPYFQRLGDSPIAIRIYPFERTKIGKLFYPSYRLWDRAEASYIARHHVPGHHKKLLPFLSRACVPVSVYRFEPPNPIVWSGTPSPRRGRHGAQEKAKAKIHQTSHSPDRCDKTIAGPVHFVSSAFPPPHYNTPRLKHRQETKQTSLTTGPPAGRASCRIICAYRLGAPFTTSTGTRNRWRLGLVNILFPSNV